MKGTKNMFTIGNDELKKANPLGSFILCNMCGKRHIIEFGKEKMPDGTWKETKFLSFYKCGNKSYLAGINGKDIRRK
jgi:hypothetical protein